MNLYYYNDDYYKLIDGKLFLIVGWSPDGECEESSITTSEFDDLIKSGEAILLSTVYAYALCHLMYFPDEIEFIESEHKLYKFFADLVSVSKSNVKFTSGTDTCEVYISPGSINGTPIVPTPIMVINSDKFAVKKRYIKTHQKHETN